MLAVSAFGGGGGADNFIPSPPPPAGPIGLIWEARVSERDGEAAIGAAVENLLVAYEQEVGSVLKPGPRGAVALKVNTRSGSGLSTSPVLVRSVVQALEGRGFSPEMIWIVDQSERTLREAGFVPPLSVGGTRFNNSPVAILDGGAFVDSEWYYESPLPGGMARWHRMGPRREEWAELFARDRRSYLADLLLFEVDFWINMPVYIDDPAIGVDGALSNATLWTVTNARRFLANPATAASAIAEIAAIPELRERTVLHLTSLWRYQFIAGPAFNSLYTRSEPLLWMSSDPVALDRMVLDKMNAARRVNGFREMYPAPSHLAFAASLGLGVDQRSRIRIESIKIDN